MPPARASIRCLLFDLGDTLWSSADARTVRRYEQAANANAAANLRALLASADSPPLDATWGGQLREQVVHAIYDAHDADPLMEPDFAALTLRALRMMGIAQADERWGGVVYEALRVRNVHRSQLYRDVLPTLAILRRRGYALGIVTNRHYGGALFLDDLRQMGLLQYFDPQHIATSADLGFRKPHPAIFQHALAGLDKTPDETAMVGDWLGADVLGANRLGIFSIWKTRSAEVTAPGDIVPDATITCIAELLSLFPPL
jgi:HAD superfamily hydrolase (TIGR01549 family)